MKKTILLTAFSIACFYNMVYGQSENKKEAIEYFEKALQADPENLHYGYILRKLKGHLSD